MVNRIIGGRLVDPGHFDGIADILIENGKIAEISENGLKRTHGQASNIQHLVSQIIDATGKIITPRLSRYACSFAGAGS